jgi:effector-binding domain-containing protein
VAYEIEVKDLEPRPTVVIRATAPRSKLPQMFPELLGELFGYVGEVGVQPSGGPFARFFGAREESIDFEIGVPVAGTVAGRGRIASGELPGGSVAVTWHIGPYDGLADAYEAIEGWMRETGRESAGPMWEIYHSDPEREPDPASWRTEVCWPIS